MWDVCADEEGHLTPESLPQSVEEFLSRIESYNKNFKVHRDFSVLLEDEIAFDL